MAKFFGKIGYIKTIESEPGIWTTDKIEKDYYGDILKNTRDINSVSDDIHDSINITNNISVVADEYANENFQYMRYVIFKGIKWEIKSASIDYPRITIFIGGVYNG